MDCSLPGSFVHIIIQARILEWVVFPFSRESSQPRNQTQVSHIRQILYHLSHQGSPSRSKHLLISWLQSPYTVILEPRKVKSVSASTFYPSICHEAMELDAMVLFFWMLCFKAAFSLSLSPSSRGSLVPLHFLPLEWYYLLIWGGWCFFWQSWFHLVIHPGQHFAWCILHVT